MVTIANVSELRPRMDNELDACNFVPRTPNIQKAWDWGKNAHAGQLRLSGEPYFETHCAWVASFIDKLVGIESWTIAALLHDAVEDTGESFEEIKALFPGELGEKVSHIIDGLTKMSSPRDGSSREIATLRKIAMFRDPAVFLVKLADKSHNLMTLQYQSPGKQWQKATEAIRAYGKLAGILNCYSWRRWIEDMSFPFAEPDSYQRVKDRIDADPRLNTNFIRYYLSELANLMTAEGLEGEVRFTVNGYWQSWDKLQRMARARKTSLQDFSALNDLISFRMILKEPSEAACYQLLGRVNKYFSKLLDQDRFDDYIAAPQNGYRALQVTSYLPGSGAVEVAIATEEMEGENTWGVVYCINNNKDISKYSPVQILTPFGGTRFLQEPATVLDGVAAIQEFYLDKIKKVVVNGEERHIYDRLNPGDVVEVITGATAKVPEPEWLNHCSASTARRLRVVLARVTLKEASKKGKAMSHAVLAERGILDLEDITALEPGRITTLLGMLACANVDDLYAAIGEGSILLREFEDTLDLVGIGSTSPRWTSLLVTGSGKINRPGILADIAKLISESQVNILRTVNHTFSDGTFQLRMVMPGLSQEQIAGLYQLLDENKTFPLEKVEIA